MTTKDDKVAEAAKAALAHEGAEKNWQPSMQVYLAARTRRGDPLPEDASLDVMYDAARADISKIEEDPMTDHIWRVSATDKTLDYLERLVQEELFLTTEEAEHTERHEEAKAILGIVKGWRQGPPADVETDDDEDPKQRLMVLLIPLMQQDGLDLPHIVKSICHASEYDNGYFFGTTWYHAAADGQQIGDTELLEVEQPQRGIVDEIESLMAQIQGGSIGADYTLVVDWIAGTVEVRP